MRATKTSLATILSIVGVLGAGSAAALVNTQILDSGPSENGVSAAALPPATEVDLTVPEATIATSLAPTTEPATTPSTEPTTTATASVAPTIAATTAPTAPPAPVASGMLTSFNVGEAGVVVVDVIDGRLVLVEAQPTPGWQITFAEEQDDGEVAVTFLSPTVKVRFRAELEDGQIVPRVESLSVDGTTTSGQGGGIQVPSNPSSGAVATTSTVRSDDDDSDDRDDDRDDDGDDDGDDDERSDDDGGERDDD